MGIGQFFKKLGSDTKKFFSKGGMAETGLKKLGSGLSKVGGVAQSLAPLAAVVAPEFAPALLAGGALAKVGGKTAGAIVSGAKSGKGIEQKTANIVGALTGGIEAGKAPAAALAPNFA